MWQYYLGWFAFTCTEYELPEIDEYFTLVCTVLCGSACSIAWTVLKAEHQLLLLK